MQFIYALHEIGFSLQYLLYGQEKISKLRDFPPEVIGYVADAVSQVERKFAGGTLSNETKMKMILILLEQYVDQPSSVSLTDEQSLALLLRS